MFDLLAQFLYIKSTLYTPSSSKTNNHQQTLLEHGFTLFIRKNMLSIALTDFYQ